MTGEFQPWPTAVFVYISLHLHPGNSCSQINLNFKDSAHAGVKVLNVLELAREQLVETRGFPGGGPYVKVRQPLALVFASQPTLAFAWGSATGEASLMTAMQQGAKHPNCARLTGIYANAEALERFFSLTPPPASVKNFKQGDSLIGRTAEEALWILGVPDETPGTPSELYRLSEWHYSDMPGRGDRVLYFQNGRVVRERLPLSF